MSELVYQRITLDSRDMEKGQYGSISGNFRLPFSFKDVQYVEFLSFTMMNTIYNINVNINTLRVTEGGPIVDVTIPVGYYTFTSLATALQTAWNASALVGNVTIVYNATTGKFTFTSTVAFSLDLSYTLGSTMDLALGIYPNQITPLGLSFTSDHVACLKYPLEIYIQLGSFTKTYYDGLGTNYSLIVDVDVPYGQVINYLYNQEFKQVTTIPNGYDLGNLPFKMITSNYWDSANYQNGFPEGVNFDWTNGQEFELVLEIVSKK